jgi:hypothetical protein
VQELALVADLVGATALKECKEYKEHKVLKDRLVEPKAQLEHKEHRVFMELKVLLERERKVCKEFVEPKEPLEPKGQQERVRKVHREPQVLALKEHKVFRVFRALMGVE